jgi:hypothetical protein
MDSAENNTLPQQHAPLYQPGELLAVLEHIEVQVLPTLLQKPDVWQSVFVDYEPPFVERLWTPVEVAGKPYRVFLHRIFPTDLDKCLFHPHPWPSAIKILSGTYIMNCGYGPGIERPPVSMQLKLATGTSYEMAHPDGWHAVSPLNEPSYSLMVTGAPWSRPSYKPGKPLQPLTFDAEAALLSFFRQAYSVSD